MSLHNPTQSYWLDAGLIEGQATRPDSDTNAIAVIGSGISGVASAFFLLEKGFDVCLMDFETQRAASFRNAGHVLYGTVESYQALVALHGRTLARSLWQLSIDICHTVKDLVQNLGLDCDYHQDGYLVIAIDEAEEIEIRNSIEMLQQDGFDSEYVDATTLESLGLRGVYGGRYEKGSAQIHPVKYRNGVLKAALKRGLRYHSQCQVTDITQDNNHALVHFNGVKEPVRFMSAVLACNAYSSEISAQMAKQRLVEPFAGQIIVSEPLPQPLQITYPHSFNHGYEYALQTPDQRLLIGGWRENVAGKEIGVFDLTPRAEVNSGLIEFVKRHYRLPTDLKWPYSWKGVMATSKTGLPFIGPTSSPLLFTTMGYTGHGMSWATGSAKLLVDIMSGEPIPEIVQRHLSPRQL